MFKKHTQQQVKLSAAFYTGNRKIKHSEQQQAAFPKFTLLMVSFQYYPVVVTGGFRRFNELKQRNPEFKTMVALGGWNEGSTSYSSVSHFQCVYIKVMFSRWYIAKAKCNVVPLNIHEGIYTRGGMVSCVLNPGITEHMTATYATNPLVPSCQIVQELKQGRA
jgi:hypothetical protein